MAVTEADSTWNPPVKGGGDNGSWLKFAQWAQALDIEASRLTVWSPVLLVIGIWIYFSLQHEPPSWLQWPSLGLCLILLLWQGAPRRAKIAALLLLGFTAAQLRAQWVETPLLRAFSPAQALTGVVVEVDAKSRARFNMVLDVAAAPGLPAAETPRRIMIATSGKHTLPNVGDTVSTTADLRPLPRPSQPGSFDYGRLLYFQSIGAVGRSTVAPLIGDASVPWQYLMRRAFHELRNTIGARVHAAIPGPIGSFADALITGERASIPRSMNSSLQASGLFHILSISGLHMALVAGGAFWTLRAGLAFFPTLALRWPLKKWAAGFTIFVGALYMLLADSGAATERSFIMIAVVFFAVMVDRPALSLHNLAVAAVLILVREPEQALAASFQMSFMAVLGLAAFFVWWQRIIPEPPTRNRSTFLVRWSRHIIMLVTASLATSLVAGLLSSIPAAHHFGRLAPYSVVSNALALPVVSIIVMPTAMASVLLMPLGLEAVPLKAMGWGLQLVMVISDWVARWPAAGMQLQRISVTVAAVLAFGMATLLIPITRVRLASIPFFLFAIVLLVQGQEKPLLLVDERAGNVALYTDQGFVPAVPKAAAASVSRWLSQAGDQAGFKVASARPGWVCKSGICTANAQNKSIAFLPKLALPNLACPTVDVLISQEPLRRRCKGKLVTIDRFDVWRSGAFAVYADGATESVQSLRGQRPWVYQPRARDSAKLHH